MDSEMTDLWNVVSQLELRKERAMSMENRILQSFPPDIEANLKIQVRTVNINLRRIE
jgi:hypothetical protein